MSDKEKEILDEIKQLNEAKQELKKDFEVKLEAMQDILDKLHQNSLQIEKKYGEYFTYGIPDEILRIERDMEIDIWLDDEDDEDEI
jgi:predicted transcriptional regulator